MAQCLIGIGSNVGDRAATIQQSMAILAGYPGVRVLAMSRLRATPAASGPGYQPEFLNAAALVETGLRPDEFLLLLQQTESQFGRARLSRWEPRTLDLDLLLYDQQTIDTALLVLPHPRMAFRRFVLEPAAEIAESMVHPGTGWTIRQLLQRLDATDDYVAITGPERVGKTRLATRAAEAVQGRVVAIPAGEVFPSGASGDRTGPAWQIELEFLRLRAEGIRKCPSAVSHRPVVLSDFWLGQTLVYAQRRLSDSQYAEFEERWSAIQADVLQPRLVVFLDVIPNPPARESREPQPAGESAPLRQALLERVSRPAQAPLLRLDASDFDWALVEVTAAIEAMKDYRV